jgi:hypothetical protein
LVLQLVVWLPLQWTRPDGGLPTDARVYYHTMRDVVAGRPVYHLIVGYGPDIVPNQFYYSPQTAVVLSAFGRMPYMSFLRMWYVLILASFWLFCGALAYISGNGRVKAMSVLRWGLVVGFTPGVYWYMSLGQIDPLLWAGFGVAMASPRLRGALLALVTQVKPLAAASLAVALVREPRTRVPAVLTLAVGVAIGIAGLGTHSFVQWYHATSPIVHQGTFLYRNASLSMSCLRIAHLLGWHYSSGPLGAAPQAFLTICQVAGILVGILWARGKSEPTAQYVRVYLAAILSSPLCWWSYLVPAYILLALKLKDCADAANGTTGEVHVESATNRQVASALHM